MLRLRTLELTVDVAYGEGNKSGDKRPPLVAITHNYAATVVRALVSDPERLWREIVSFGFGA